MSSDVISKVTEITSAFSRNNEAINAHFKGVYNRLEQLESGRDRPRGAGGSSYSAEDNEHKSVFIEWMRKPTDPRREGRLSEAQEQLSRKDVSLGSQAGGGYALPKEISSEIEMRVRQLNPFRGTGAPLVDVQTAGTNDFHSLVSMGDGSSGWVSETGSRSATLSPTLRDVAPTFGELYAYPTATNWSLQDLFFDVQQWLVNDIAADWASQEATAILSGSGNSQPTGILHTAPVSTADNASPMRAQDAIQYQGLTSPASPLALTFDSFIDLVSQVKERYLTETDRCAWVMHRTTVARLRKLKASTAGTYLWENDSQAGTPLMLLGYPVRTCDAVPQVAAGNIVAIFGNWRRGYLLVDRVGMQITVDPYTSPGSTKFYVRARRGGRVKSNDCLKALKIV